MNCEQTAERTPSIPPSSAIRIVTEPTQCPSTWTVSAPVRSRTSATAAGQSSRATSSIVDGMRDEGRAMLAR